MMMVSTVLEAKFLRASGPTVRWYIEDDPFLPGVLLAELDYTRDAPPERRAAMYRRERHEEQGRRHEQEFAFPLNNG